MLKNKLNYKLINITALMLFLYIGLSNINLWISVLASIVNVLLPFLIAFVFAYAFAPLVKWLESKGMKKGLAVTLVVLIVIFVIIGLLTATLPLVYEQLLSLSKIVSRLVSQTGNKFDVNIAGFTIKITDYLGVMIKKVGKMLSEGTFDFLSKSVGFFGTFIIGFIAWIYFLADMSKIRTFCREFLQSLKNRSYEYFKCLDNEIGNYIQGLTLFMVIQFFEYSLVYFIAGHPNWLLIGILASLTTVIPYFGGLITNLIALITASVVSTPVFIGTIIICMIFPQLDGYFISPKIYGRTNNVNPLITIMAVSIGGTLAGVLGIVAALPVYLFIRTTYKFFKKDIKKVGKQLKA